MRKKVKFTKMHGAGNDFLCIDNRGGSLPELDGEAISRLCNRRTGVGADGLLILEKAGGYDFRMRYFNADGSSGGMCGNGARCMVFFASTLTGGKKFNFVADDGEHTGWIGSQEEDAEEVHVSVTIRSEMSAKRCSAGGRDGYLIRTGVPHFVTELLEDDEKDVVSTGRRLRHDPAFGEEGANVDFVKEKPEGFTVRTYERGVEDETLACGTGAVAVALVLRETGKGEFPLDLDYPYGRLRIDEGESENELILTGPAELVYEGFFFL